MNAHADIKPSDVPFAMKKTDPSQPAFLPTGRTTLAVFVGFTIDVAGKAVTVPVSREVAFDAEAAAPGSDHVVIVTQDGALIAVPFGDAREAQGIRVGGFHYAPGGNSAGVAGGDDVPAINPFSCWDLNFRPACPDPRGMALIDGTFWCDIYLFATATQSGDTSSRFGAKIADGRSLKKFDYAEAKALVAFHGKTLLGAEEYFAAAYGVTERSSAEVDPDSTKLDAPRTSRHGIIQATGNMWVWGTDGHPDDPRASLFGGSWVRGQNAGSRFANLVYWPDLSDEGLGARGRSDHLILA